MNDYNVCEHDNQLFKNNIIPDGMIVCVKCGKLGNEHDLSVKEAFDRLVDAAQRYWLYDEECEQGCVDIIAKELKIRYTRR
jgi:hypothetical protein